MTESIFDEDEIEIAEPETFGGYQAAQIIDNHLGKLIEKYDITKENLREWLSFTRVIETSLHLINEKVVRVGNLKQRRWDDPRT
jgi:hypothetical protein